MIYVAQDNGVTGRLAALSSEGSVLAFLEVPTTSELGWTKKEKHVTRIDWAILRNWYEELKGKGELRIFVERPMIFPGRFAATISAVRSFEATLITLELCGMAPTRVVDSKEWQKKILPEGCKDTKAASRDVGSRLFPAHASSITRTKTTDADALLMAEVARREKW